MIFRSPSGYLTKASASNGHRLNTALPSQSTEEDSDYFQLQDEDYVIILREPFLQRTGQRNIINWVVFIPSHGDISCVLLISI